MPLAFSSEGSGAAVLLLHGQCASRVVWYRLQPMLSAAGFQVIVVDRPGYGETTDAAAGFEANARAAFSVLDRLGVDRVTVFGHSWSGAVAVLMALRQPARIRGLVLQGSIGGTGSVTVLDRVLALPGVGELAFLVGLRAVVRAMQFEPVRRRIAPELVALPRSQLAAIAALWSRRRTAYSGACEQRALVAELPAVQAQLAAVRTPVEVLIGRDDVRVRPPSQRDLAARLPYAEVVEVDGGHLLAVEAPDQVVAAIRLAMARAA